MDEPLFIEIIEPVDVSVTGVDIDIFPPSLFLDIPVSTNIEPVFELTECPVVIIILPDESTPDPVVKVKFPPGNLLPEPVLTEIAPPK